MIYIENNLEKQDVFIPRNDGSTCYVSPYDKGYQDGYQDGIEDCGDCPIQQKEVVLTATTETISPDQGYAGMDSVFVDARQLALEKYNEGYHEGEEDGAEEQKDKLASTAFTQNGIYRREDGWNEVEVSVGDIPCVLEEKSAIVTANTQTVLPSSGYEGMSAVEIDATDFGYAQYISGWGDGINNQKSKLSGDTFTENGDYLRADGWSAVTVDVRPQLETKNIVLTAATECITKTPDTTYIGFAVPKWARENGINTGIKTDSATTIRVKYIGRGQQSDRVAGIIQYFDGASWDWRFFDSPGMGKTRYYRCGSKSINDSTTGQSFTEAGVLYDYTMEKDTLYDNINGVVVFELTGATIPTNHNIWVDVGSIWLEELTIEKGEGVVFHGIAYDDGEGTIGLYDSVSDSVFTLYSGSSGTLVTYTAVYDGIGEVCVDATNICQTYYSEGYQDGQAECPPCPEIESAVTYGIGSGFTGATITPSSGYDGMAEVTITDNGYGQEKYDEGHDDGYNEGFTDGQTDILSGLTDTTITQNGTYSNPSGWSGVTVAVPQTGSSCNLQQKAITLESGDTSPWAVTPDAGYDGMSGVTITDNGYGQEKYDEGYQDGSIASCNLQTKTVVLTALTECIYPDTSGYEYYLGFESPSWAIKNLIDTGVYPTQTSTARIKYKGRGVRSDRIVGSIDGYQGCNDNSDYRVFDAIGFTVDVGSSRRTIYSISSITETDVIYDITFGNAYAYDNINETYLLQNGTQNVNTGYTYTVDVGSFWLKELIIEDNGVTLFNGTPREENGVAGIYDSVSNSFFTLFSGSTGSTVMHAEPVGYTGLASVCVDASGIYNQGYEDGKKETEGSNNYFTFEAIEDGEIGFHYEECDTSVPQTYTALTVSYSINGGSWNSITSTTAATNQIVVNAGDIVRFKGINDALTNYSSSGCLIHHKIINTNNCYVYGNIMSLLYGDDFEGQEELTEDYAFSSFFSGNQNILLHPTKPLSLPATGLTNSCYSYMFSGCKITSAPKLPATTLANGCYRYMFKDCINLSVAPSLPATELESDCYSHMFSGCTSLTVAPELPATTLVGNCYDSMFEDCASLTAAPELPATTVPTSGFFGAYSSMFMGCSSLSYIKCNATTFDAQYGLDDWVYGVAANGVFLKNSSMNNWPTGDNGIPSGWTVRDIQ